MIDEVRMEFGEQGATQQVASIFGSDFSDMITLENRLKRTLDEDEQRIFLGLRALARKCYEASAKAGWWTDLATGIPLVRNRGEMLMLMVSEISEAMEGERKSLRDDKLPHRPMAEVEMADAVIREGDYCGGFCYDLAGAVIEKLAYNATRADHKVENRKLEDGKKF